jgi:hypothetical protein
MSSPLAPIHKALLEALDTHNASIYPGKIEIYFSGRTDRRINLIAYGSGEITKRNTCMLTYFINGNHKTPRNTITLTNTRILNDDHLFRQANLESVQVLLETYSSIIRGQEEMTSDELDGVIPHSQYLEKFNYILSSLNT